MAPQSASLSTEPMDVEAPLEDYRPISGMAVAGVLLGLASILALTHPVLYVVPIAGAAVSVIALRQIARASPPMVGRRAALAGLALSLVCGISAPVKGELYRRALRAEAIEVATRFFTALRENRPDEAHRLTGHPTVLSPVVHSPVKVKELSELQYDSLRKYVQEPAVGLLLKLGKRARIRLFMNDDVWSDQTFEGVREIYVVTVGEGPEAVSFFIRLGCTRTRDVVTGNWGWQVTKHELITLPPERLLAYLEG